MNPKDLNLILFMLLAIWLCFILLFDWNRVRLNRALVTSFILAVISNIFVRYGSYVEQYSYGLNYFRDYIRPQFGLYNSYFISSIFLIIALILLLWGLKVHVLFARQRMRLQMKTSVFILIALLGLLLGLFTLVLSLVFALLFFSLFPNWTNIPTVVIGIILILKILKPLNFSTTHLLICFILVVHMFIPWICSSFLANKYKLGFDGGFAEAVEENVDIASIHNWMVERRCSEIIETYQADESYAKLPGFIQSLNPSEVKFTTSCDSDEISQLILGYPSTWIDPFGLAIVYPPMSAEQLLTQGYPIEGYPISISDHCSCYIYSPSK